MTHFSLRFLIFFLLIFLQRPGIAQTGQGSVLLGMNGSLVSANIQPKRFAGGNTNVEFGYAFFKNFFVGAAYQLSYTALPIDEGKINVPGYGLFGRYYLLNGKNRIYLEPRFGHANSFANYTEDKLDIGIGFNHFLSKYVALEAQLDYNIFTKQQFSIQANFPNDPLYSNKKESTGLAMNLELRFFLPPGRHNEERETYPALPERFLKKGNKNIELSGNINFDPKAYLTIINYSTFIKDRLKLQHRYYGGGFITRSSIRNLSHYSLNLENYQSLYGRLYFNFNIGIGPYLNLSFKDNDDYYGANANASLGLVHFFKNANIGFGISAYGLKYINVNADTYFSSNLYLSSEIFLNETLAFKPIAYLNLTDDPSPLINLENNGLVYVQNFQLRWGFSYYFGRH